MKGKEEEKLGAAWGFFVVVAIFLDICFDASEKCYGDEQQ